MFESIIQRQAKKNKDALAYSDNTGSVTYRKMAEDIGCCSRWLKMRGIKRGDRIVLRLASFYSQWVLFFALEDCGAVSILTSASHELGEAKMEFLRAERYITDTAVDEGVAGRGEVLDRGWLERVRRFRSNLSTSLRRSGDDVVCILLSSGTTGTEKKIAITRRVLDTRAISDRSLDLINPNSRLLLLYPKDSIGSLVTTMSIFDIGAAVCVKLDDYGSMETFEKNQPTTVMGAPSHYEWLLGALKDDFVPEHAIDAATGGGLIPPSVIALMRKRLGGKIKISYASTETGLVARGDISLAEEHDGAVGFVLPSVDVSVRDETGLPLPFGEIGEIWVRSPHVVDGYQEDPEQTALRFRDGWFRPGDVGSLQENGLLKIRGRIDDLMNYRGIKLMPSDVERFVDRIAWCEEAIAFMAKSPNGDERHIWIVCVASGKVEIEDVRKALPAYIPFNLALIDAIPRNEMGKANRVLLRLQAESGQLDARRVNDAAM